VVSDERVAELEKIAAQLAGRVRDDDPEANARWLAAHVHGADEWRALAIILAAAVPVTEPFSRLVAWTRLDWERIEHRRAVLDEALHPRKRAAV
jgi:hypothetical protein